MKRVMNRKYHCYLYIFFTVLSLSFFSSIGVSVPKKILTITPKFARQKKAALKKELEQRVKQGFFLSFGTPQEQKETYSVMARNFGINVDQMPLYIQNLNEQSTGAPVGTQSGSSGLTSGDGFASGVTTTGQGGESSSGTGSGSRPNTGTGDIVGGTTGDQQSVGTGINQLGVENTGSTMQEVQHITQDLSEKIPVDQQMPELLDDLDQPQEHKITEKIRFNPFEYTLEPLNNFNNLSQQDKEQSDELLWSILLRLMQVSVSAQHKSMKANWIDEAGKITDIPSGYFGPTLPEGMQKPNMVQPRNGFEAQYLIMKEQLVAYVGLVEGFKKRKEMRDLLGSEEVDGTLKKFIDISLKDSSFDTLYGQLVHENRQLLAQWLKLFGPCFFDTQWVHRERHQQVLETILINIIVSRKSANNFGLSYQIASDNEVKRVLKSLLKRISPFIPQQESSENDSEFTQQQEHTEQSIVKNKEETKNLLNKFLQQKSSSSQNESKKEISIQKKHDVIVLDRDYGAVLYDQLNRLRVNSHFEKMFAIIGHEALVRYDKDQSPLKNNLFPLLLWLFDSERIKTAVSFREMVRNQLVFNKEDNDIKKIFSDMLPWNIVFDFHNLENKKHRKKVDVVAYINDQLKQQKSIQGVRGVVLRLKPLVVEQSLTKLQGLNELLQSLDVTKDAVVDLFEDIIKNENSLSALDGSAKSTIVKIINEYVATNQKTIGIIEYLKEIKKIYNQKKTTITQEMYDTFAKRNEKLQYMVKFKVKPFFSDLYRMPATLYREFVKIAGKKQLVSDIITEDDFYNYTVAYGLLLKVLEESQGNLLMLRNSLNAMNTGIVKAQELYADSISKNNENKTIIQKGIYQGKLQGVVDALKEGDPIKIRQAVSTFVGSDAINPMAESKYKDLINTFISNISAQLMLQYSIMIKVLNEGSAQCPENVANCLIPQLPLEGIDVSQKEKVRNAHIYKRLTGLLSALSTLLNPNNQPLTAQGLSTLNVAAVTQGFKEAIEKIKGVLTDQNFDSYWVDQKNKESERNNVLRIIEEHFNNVGAAITQLKMSVGDTAPVITPQFTQDGGFSPPPPPPPNPMETSGNEGTIPPPPPPPPGF